MKAYTPKPNVQQVKRSAQPSIGDSISTHQPVAGQPFSPDNVPALQRAYGNRAVNGLIQRQRAPVLPTISTAPTHTLQPLMNAEGLKTKAGNPKFGFWASTSYKQILKKLTQYHAFVAENDFDVDGKITRLNELKTLVTNFIVSKGEEFASKTGASDQRRIKKRIDGMTDLDLEISQELSRIVPLKRMVDKHIATESESDGGLRGESLVNLKPELARLAGSFGFAGKDEGPARFVTKYNDFRIEYNNLLALKNAYVRAGKRIPNDVPDGVRLRSMQLMSKIGPVIVGEGLGVGTTRDDLALAYRQDFYDNDPALMYEALGLTKSVGKGMTAAEIQEWARENAGKVETLGGVIGANESDNPFRAALFFLRDASNKAVYDAFLEGTEEALLPFVFPEELKVKFMQLSALAGGLFS